MPPKPKIHLNTKYHDEKACFPAACPSAFDRALRLRRPSVEEPIQGEWTYTTNVILPKSLETVEDAAFEGLAGQCYFLEADALPAGFASRWTGKDASVYTGGQWSLVNGTPTVG